MFPSILIQLENSPNEFIFIFISSSDTNLLRKKSVKQKIKKRWPYVDTLEPKFYIVKLGFTGVNITFLNFTRNIDCGYSLELPH